jgi:hypothetical protein
MGYLLMFMGYLLMFSNSFDCVYDRLIGRSVNSALESKPKEGVVANLVLFSPSTGEAEVNHDYCLTR